MNPTPGKRLEIRLNARPTPGIRAGDGENTRKPLRTHGDGRIGAVA
jgi:hypothetical protein